MAGRKSASFFDIYADEYDLMTNAAAREAPHDREVRALIERFQPERVLDAGCATGLTAYLFARQGIATVGLDRSRAMIRIARQKYEHLGLPLEFRVGWFERIPQRLHRRFDLVVCLANSISGVGTRARLRDALRGFYRALKPGSYLVIQMLNFAAVREGELIPIKATVNGGIIYERFVERQRQRFFVYVTRLDTRQKPPKLEAFRHDFDNFTEREMVQSLRRQGFEAIERYGDLRLTRPFTRSSRDVVLVCHTRRS